jgi:transposase
MTIQEACQRLGKSESTIRRWIRSGKVAATLKDGVYDIAEDSTISPPDDQSSPNQNDQIITQLRSENDYLKERIKELEQARERADMITMQLSRQLEQKALPSPSWIRRIFKSKH